MKYDWKEAGEEWSTPWGTSSAQWSGAILPRIRHCLPTDTVLEIAPGYGRWTQYLKDYCRELSIVDRVDECIEACRHRFAANSHVHCYLNDGRSLPMIPDGSVDFAFSFDSLVHTKREVVESYLRELGQKLKIGGKGFIHHSNFGEYADSPRERIPALLAKPLIKAKILDWAHHRSADMTAEIFRTLSVKHGLCCDSQELVNWRGWRLIDCFSIVTRADSSEQMPTRINRNRDFMREAAEIRARSAVTQSVVR